MFTPRNIKRVVSGTAALSYRRSQCLVAINQTTLLDINGRASLRDFSTQTGSNEQHQEKKSFNNRKSQGLALVVGGLLSSIAAYYYFDRNNADDNLQSLLAQALSAQENSTREELERTNKNVNALLQHNTPIYRVVLTGGPCAGKSSAMTKLRERLQNLGFQVFIIPEAATLLMTGGAKVTDNSSVEDVLAFESSLIKTQMAIEDNFQEIARVSKKPTILLCDRGTLDPKAYMTDDLWQALMDMNGWSIPMLRDKRYDCVIHLVTTAIGAEKFYTLENNTVRTETIEQARELDHRLRASYIGHSQLYIVDNAVNSFDEKLQKVYNILSHQIGIPRAKSSRRRFLLKPIDKVEMDLRHEVIDLEQIFIPTGNEKDVTRIVKRGQNGVFTYSYHSTQTIEEGLEKIEARPISARTYVNLSSQADKTRMPILKKIYSFVYMNHYFELNHYLNGKGKGTTILTVEAVAGQEVSIPPFLGPYILEEVTDNTKLSSYEYALRD